MIEVCPGCKASLEAVEHAYHSASRMLAVALQFGSTGIYGLDDLSLKVAVASEREHEGQPIADGPQESLRRRDPAQPVAHGRDGVRCERGGRADLVARRRRTADATDAAGSGGASHG